jgi:hypothetical protein
LQACDGLDLKDLKFQSSSLILGLDLELNPFQNFGFGTENPILRSPNIKSKSGFKSFLRNF